MSLKHVCIDFQCVPIHKLVGCLLPVEFSTQQTLREACAKTDLKFLTDLFIGFLLWCLHVSQLTKNCSIMVHSFWGHTLASMKKNRDKYTQGNYVFSCNYTTLTMAFGCYMWWSLWANLWWTLLSPWCLGSMESHVTFHNRISTGLKNLQYHVYHIFFFFGTEKNCQS